VNVETNAETLHYHFDKRNLRNLRTGRNPRTKAELKTMPAEGGGGSNITQTRIVGGTGAPQGKYPYFLQWAWGCGATLIHSDILLTAAQCDGTNIPTTVIGCGCLPKWPGNFGAEVRQVVERSRHPKSNSFTDVND
jgi:hypothetical protein